MANVLTSGLASGLANNAVTSAATGSGHGVASRSPNGSTPATQLSTQPAPTPQGRFWLREATKADAAILAAIIQAAYVEFQDRLDPPSRAHDETEGTMRGLFESERGVLAGWGDVAAGCVFFRTDVRDTYLHRLAVLPAYRRHGIGRALVAAVETQARQAASERVRLGVRLQLPANQLFYRNLGYTVTSHHSHPGYSVPTYVSMTKDISEPPQRLIEVVPPNPDWPRQFEAEAALLKLVFGDLLAEIHHIGSTAIAGIHAKPIIDMMPLVYDIEAVDSYNGVMEALGYRAWGEYGIAGRRYFSRAPKRRTHQVHLFQLGGAEVQRHLAFRDYLRAHPEKALVYGDHKRLVAIQNSYDNEGYMDGKDTLVKQLEVEAMAWRMQQGAGK
jgi:GrpB-like predicted nucleotidyltransferase (UPF0157 family)/ribosomal protein S18 acetylase RimI-like enzyme